jgi:SOS-response transcriptional repressor LexA
MPGGSGLLSQILERWKEVRDAGLETVAGCKGQCERSCYECLRIYRNVFYHALLDRHAAKRILDAMPEVNWEREIPAHAAGARVMVGRPTNPGEEVLGALLERAGFPAPRRQHEIPIDQPVPTTTPDFAYVEEAERIYVAIYLDGLSKEIHGNADRARMDAMIRSVLEARGWQVLVIASSSLNDPQAMLLHFQRLAHALRQRDRVKTLAEDRSWFSAAAQYEALGRKESVAEAARRVLKMVARELARPFEVHPPVYSLRAAAGKFGEGQDVQEEGWVEVRGHRLREGMFVAQVVGKSMEPRVPDGSYCIFRAPVEGTRQDKTVLVQHYRIEDPDTGGSYTVKRYKSKKVSGDAGTWEHAEIRLEPLNNEFEPIVLRDLRENELRVVAEFLDVLR